MQKAAGLFVAMRISGAPRGPKMAKNLNFGPQIHDHGTKVIFLDPRPPRSVIWLIFIFL